MAHHDARFLQGPTGLDIFYRGPELAKEPLPAFIYFALTGYESLHLEPFCQPATLLEETNVRVFSFTLPSHGVDTNPRNAMLHWGERLAKNENFVEDFTTQCIENLDYLVAQGHINTDHIATGGLSRGGFIATHLAARDRRVGTVLGYAPLTRLDALGEFQDNALVESLALVQQVDQLVDKHVRFYIGNRDIRVSTEKCFEFIHTLADTAYQKGFRSPTAELMISPSIGHKGHGTPPHIFQDGVDWLKSRLSPQ